MATRRRWLRACGAVLAWLATQRPQAAAQKALSTSPPTRVSQREAGYQPTPNGIQICGACTLFVRPNACKVVDGQIDRFGWCRLYDMTD